VEKKAKLYIAETELAAEDTGEEHKMVVMNPNSVPWLDYLGKCVCKCIIDNIVGFPFVFFEVDIPGKVVEKRPENTESSVAINF